MYIAVLLIGPRNNQVFVDFPCGRGGIGRQSHLHRSGRPGKAFKSVNVKNAHGPETASRGDRSVGENQQTFQVPKLEVVL